MDLTERLAAIEEIKQLKARYFLGVDTKDWELWRNAVFTPDISLIPEEGYPGGFHGIDAVIAWISEAMAQGWRIARVRITRLRAEYHGPKEATGV